MKKLYVVKTKIYGLNHSFFYFSHRHFYAKYITFSAFLFCNLCQNHMFCMGKKNDEAREYIKTFIGNFNKAGIKNGTNVYVIFSDDGRDSELLAIGKSKESLWIDVKDNCNPKEYNVLSFDSNLTIHPVGCVF